MALILWLSLREFVEMQIAGPTPRVAGSVSLGWGPTVCFFYRFLGRADAASLEPSSENGCVRVKQMYWNNYW